MDYKTISTGFLVFGVLVLAWVFYSAFQITETSYYAQNSLPTNSQANVPQSSLAQQTTQQQTQIPAKCGNIEDPQNIQHLSHHPDQFQDCLKLVDPVKFKNAVGRDVSEFLR
ncbi:MAG: hypothetical protein HZA83_02470 [Thaumarchaeota archaeon]|nr:hypothetical protein [Nitrososphaerota archaeon]